MTENNDLKPYFASIEKILVDYIQDAETSVKIAMAWFTSNKIKDSLIELRKRKSQIIIEIVVDDNSINKKYFFDYQEIFKEAEIEIYHKAIKKFLHDKFIVIDDKITITGSYNYTKNAKSNLENITVISNNTLSLIYSRRFQFLVNECYLDENICLLIDYPDFAQELLSTYYNFSKKEYQKYKEKIVIGDCFTHDNGLYDEIEYEPGLIFNPKVILEKKIKNHEFILPVKKNMIKNWVKGRNNSIVLSYNNGKEDEYEYLNDDLEDNERKTELYFRRKIENTFQSGKLKELIENKVDIIIEDYLWLCNFEPFLNEKIIEKIFEKIPVINKNYLS